MVEQIECKELGARVDKTLEAQYAELLKPLIEKTPRNNSMLKDYIQLQTTRRIRGSAFLFVNPSQEQVSRSG